MSDFPIFSVLGIEIEYMLVDKTHFNVQPKSDVILQAIAGKIVNEASLGEIMLSNELVMHVIEFKNNGPRPSSTPMAAQFQQAIRDIQPHLEKHNLVLMPSGAHPWMNPERETVRWPHGNNQLYQQFDAIFNCKGHGWSNLQSMHVNLPYANDEEFCHLHNLIRLILPLLPALAASTPIIEGSPTGLLDTRLHFYTQNQQRIPSICADVIPDFIRSEKEYQEKILEPMYADIRPFDPDGILQYPWLNSRGCIPKLIPKAIEIRILDSQECVTADIAIAKLIEAVLKKWHESSSYYLENPCDTDKLKNVFKASIKNGLATHIDDPELSQQWQIPKGKKSIREIWSLLVEKNAASFDLKEQQVLEQILSTGNLSERILQALGKNAHLESIKEIYEQLTLCLLSDQQFVS